MTRPSLTLVTMLWNGERHGFPWVELLCEGLAECDAVIVANPEGEDDEEPRGTRAKLLAWASREPRLKVIKLPPANGMRDLARMVNLAIEAAKTEYVLHVQADEAMDLSGQRFWGLFEVGNVAKLLHEGWAVSFPRLDFTCSSSHVTPIFEDEPACVRLMARDQWPDVAATGDAMHLSATHGVYLHEASPIFHYHGLASERGWQAKEIAFQTLYQNDGVLNVDPNLVKGWPAWTGPVARARPNTAPHPKLWHPYLARADMTTRDLLSEKRQLPMESAPILDTDVPLG